MLRAFDANDEGFPPHPTDVERRRLDIHQRDGHQAEDNRVNQKVASFMLKKLGYESDVVGNGIEALRALESADCALILMDSHMPELDGFAATAAIRGMGGKFRDIPIVALTADAQTGDREKCVEAGMNDYLSKPVTLDALDRVLSHWLRQDADA